MVDSIFTMPVDNLCPDEVPGTPNAFQACSPSPVPLITTSSFCSALYAPKPKRIAHHQHDSQ